MFYNQWVMLTILYHFIYNSILITNKSQNYQAVFKTHTVYCLRQDTITSSGPAWVCFVPYINTVSIFPRQQIEPISSSIPSFRRLNAYPSLVRMIHLLHPFLLTSIHQALDCWQLQVHQRKRAISYPSLVRMIHLHHLFP